MLDGQMREIGSIADRLRYLARGNPNYQQVLFEISNLVDETESAINSVINDNNYRHWEVMHRNRELIIRWLNDENLKVQLRAHVELERGTIPAWVDCDCPVFNDQNLDYRIKPEEPETEDE